MTHNRVSSANPWLIAVVVTLGAFMEVLDTTIVNVTLPHIAGSLAVSVDESTWTLTTYLVANGIVLTISNSLSIRIGRKRYFFPGADDERAVITTAVLISTTLSRTTPGGIRAVGWNSRAMPRMSLMTRQADTITPRLIT